jgi:hypothetical protein
MKTFLSLIVIFIIVGLSIALYKTNDNLKKERQFRQTQLDKEISNYNSLRDSISVDFNRRLKAWEYSKDNFLLQKLSDLEAYNKVLYDQLKKVKGDIIAAVKTEAQINLNGISANNGLIIIDPLTNHYGLNFKSEYKDDGFEQKLIGTSKFYLSQDILNKKWIISPDVTVIDTNLTSIKVTYGFKEYKDKYQVFAICQSPKVQLTDLTGGYFINKQPTIPIKVKKWGLGPYIGVGMNTGTQNVIGFSIGIGLHYDIYQFNF